MAYRGKICVNPLLVDCAQVLGVQAFALPDGGKDEIDAGHRRAGSDDAVRVPLQEAVESDEFERFLRREQKAGLDELRPHSGLEEMSPVENRPHPRRQRRNAPPVKLHLTRAFVPDDRGAEIDPRQHRGGRGGALDPGVQRDADRRRGEQRAAVGVGKVDDGHVAFSSFAAVDLSA